MANAGTPNIMGHWGQWPPSGKGGGYVLDGESTGVGTGAVRRPGEGVQGNPPPKIPTGKIGSAKPSKGGRAAA